MGGGNYRTLKFTLVSLKILPYVSYVISLMILPVVSVTALSYTATLRSDHFGSEPIKAKQFAFILRFSPTWS